MFSLTKPLTYLLTAAILTGLLFSILIPRAQTLANGKELVLQTVPVDPRDLFRGYYVRLNYKISTVKSCEIELPDSLERQTPIYVGLEKEADDWKIVRLTKERPTEGDFLKGRLRYSYKKRTRRKNYCPTLRLVYGIEKYFAPKERAKELEDIQRNGRRVNRRNPAEAARETHPVHVITRVDEDGVPTIAGLKIKGKMILEEKVF